MHISLILTGSDRHDELSRFFVSLLSVDLSKCHTAELIFINQGVFEPPLSIRTQDWLSYLQLKRGRLPLSYARNIGIQHSSGDIFGFPDDDCWYPPTALEQVAEYFENHPSTAAICTNVYDPGLKRSYGGRPVGPHVRVNYRNLFELPISVGIFVRRNAFEAAGFHFDEKLGAGTPLGSGEETDLIYRLLKSGALVEYLGSIQVFHPVPEYQETDIEKYRRYGLGFGYLNGQIVRDGQWRVLHHLGVVLVRSLGGTLKNLHRSTRRRLYWNRLLGIVQGFVRGVRGLPC